jgi:hypothetical protein
LMPSLQQGTACSSPSGSASNAAIDDKADQCASREPSRRMLTAKPAGRRQLGSWSEELGSRHFYRRRNLPRSGKGVGAGSGEGKCSDAPPIALCRSAPLYAARRYSPPVPGLPGLCAAGTARCAFYSGRLARATTRCERHGCAQSGLRAKCLTTDRRQRVVVAA